MERRVGSILYLALLILELLIGCCSEVVVNSYTHNSTLTSGDSVPLGTQLILVCRVVGLPYGTPHSYSWTCPNRPCEVEGYYGRRIYNEHILAVNTTSTSDKGTYTCQVTATGGQGANGSFSLRVTGADVVHSYGRLIPHEFPITHLQQISGPDGIGRVNCTVSSGTARFKANGGQLETGGVSQTSTRAIDTATLVVKPSNDSFPNRGLYCTNSAANFFYLFISSANPLSVPGLMVDRVTNSAVEYQVTRNDAITNPLIAGYEVFRFGVPMIGEYVNTGRGRRVTISPAVPGAQYRITAWATTGGGRRSATPMVAHITAGEARPSSPRDPTITREFQDGMEINWLPSAEPNGEVHYVIYYTPEGGTEQSTDTGSNLTHYNLTGLERNRVYANIAVQAVNSVGRSAKSAVIAQYNHTPPETPGTGPPPPPGPSSTADASSTGFTTPPGPPNTAAIIAGVVVTFLVVVLLSLVGGVVAVVVVVKRKRKMTETAQSHSKAYLEDSLHEGKGPKDICMYQYVQNQPTAASGHKEPYYSTADNFTNPASATASFSVHMYDSADYSKVDAGGEGLYEEARVEERWGGGEYSGEHEPVKGAGRGQNKSAVEKANCELVNPEELYTQPDKMAKVKKDMQGHKSEQRAAPLEDLYTMPDMTKKMEQRNQQCWEQESEEKKLAPQAPIPYKKHKEAKHESGENGDDVPEVPPPYVPDEEQYYNTRGGAGPPSLERRYDYAVLDWQQK